MHDVFPRILWRTLVKTTPPTHPTSEPSTSAQLVEMTVPQPTKHTGLHGGTQGPPRHIKSRYQGTLPYCNLWVRKLSGKNSDGVGSGKGGLFTNEAT